MSQKLLIFARTRRAEKNTIFGAFWTNFPQNIAFVQLKILWPKVFFKGFGNTLKLFTNETVVPLNPTIKVLKKSLS